MPNFCKQPDPCISNQANDEGLAWSGNNSSSCHLGGSALLRDLPSKLWNLMHYTS